MLKAGLDKDVIVGKIQSSRCDFDTSPTALVELKAVGVIDSVLLAMIKSSAPLGRPVDVAHDRNESPTSAPARDANCKVYFSVIQINEHIPGIPILVGMDEDQWNWFAKQSRETPEGKKHGVCYIVDPRDSRVSALVVWSTEHWRSSIEWPITRTSTTDIHFHGNIETYGRATTREQGQEEIPITGKSVYAAVYHIRTNPNNADDRTLDPEAAVYSSENTPQWRWSKPTRDALKDALEFIASGLK
jgi:hypothetical protein